MKIIAINSSPVGNKGHTAMILTPFLEGIKDAGADVSLYLTKDLKINPCCGQFTCSIHNKDCIHKDDMAAIHPKLLKADIWVFATPLYISGMNGPMKTFMDRMLIPWGDTYVCDEDGRSHHPIKKKIENGKVVLVSSCAYWERENFNLLLDHMKEFCFHAEREFVGALLRPHSPMMKHSEGIEDKIKAITEAAYKAGQDLVSENKINQELKDILSQPLIPREYFVRSRE
jgi:multimeric flavodoxin WrbA